jgi:bifunctional non-homologous end joining protein LigD
VRVATWNVNNVVKRLDLLLDWLARARPDVVALQELKTPSADFPADALREAGYASLVVGQRSWNGVALLARGHEPLPVVKALPGDPKDKEARYVEAAIHGVLFGCLYLPNGNPQPGPKFDHKLRWFERMRQRAAALWASGQPVVLLGDWNVVPTDDDIYQPDTWRTDALLQPAVREAYAAVLAQGWTDALASAHQAGRHFTFWDYRRKRWERNAGLRIDHILVSAGLQVVDAGVDRDERGREGASDHAPVWAEIRQAKAPRAARVAADEVLAQGRKAALPARLAPQLATLVSAVAPGDWVVETKFDGYRLLARIDGDDVRLFTRNGHDWTDKLRPVADAVEALGMDRAWLDTEIVVLNDAGVPDFNRLQNAIDQAATHDIVMFAFDLPFCGGRDLRQLPLASRRALLRQLLDARASEKIRFSESFDAVPGAMLSAACQMGLEGVIVKRADAPYASGRTETWMKLKCQHRQEFVVVGFTDRAGAGREVGGLLLGYHEAGALRFAGTVGTGWGASTGRELHELLSQLKVDQPPVDPADAKPGRWSHRSAGAEHWVKPVTVVEVAFAEWTPDRRVRHAVFRGLRTDKPATQIVRERAKTPAGAMSSPAKPARPKTRASTVRITNPERVIDPTTGLRKIDLVRYYESIAEWMLPHLKNRPVSLVRAPTGITGELFYQKHPETKMPGMKELDAALWPGHAALLAVDSAEALVVAAQMNVVEFHTWNSRTNHIDQPDRFILDLDPGEGVTWPMLQEAAVLTRAMLEELGLACWLKTSGGKGLHVVVPLTPKLDDAEVKAFSQAVVRHMAKVIPSRFVAVMGGGNRVGKIFIDYLRNGHGQTTACAFSARSRPGLGVSMPVGWDQLAELKGGAQWTIATARDYLSSQQQDPWSGYWKKRQSLRSAIKLLA